MTNWIRWLAYGLMVAAVMGALAASLWFSTLGLEVKLRWIGVESLGEGAGWISDQNRASSQPLYCVALLPPAGVSAVPDPTNNALVFKDWLVENQKRKWVGSVRMVGVNRLRHQPDARAQARSARVLLEPLCPRWTVVGASLESALWLALDWPEGVEKLVLLANGPTFNDPALSERVGHIQAPTQVLWTPATGKPQIAIPHAIFKLLEECQGPIHTNCVNQGLNSVGEMLGYGVM